MNKQDALKRLDEIIRKHGEYAAMQEYDGGDWYDTEDAHFDADKVLCDLLTELDFGEVVEKYHSVPKWYA